MQAVPFCKSLEPVLHQLFITSLCFICVWFSKNIHEWKHCQTFSVSIFSNNGAWIIHFWSILSKTAPSSYSECSHPGFVFPHNLFPSEPWQPEHMIWQKIVFHWFLTWYPRFSLIILFLSRLRGVVAPTDSRRQLRLVLLPHKVTVSMATGPWLVFPLFSLFLIYFSPLSFHICDRCVWRALWAAPPTLTHVPPDRKLLSLKH